MNLVEQLKYCYHKLSTAQIENPQNESELILSQVLNLSRSELYLNRKEKIDPKLASQIDSLIEKRILGIPLQYLFGETEFYGLIFKVDQSVLIPRPETEILVEKILGEIKTENIKILDIGTGSGAIAITLAYHFPEAQITATDVSEKAIITAAKNAKLNQVKINFIISDLFKNISDRYDIIISNPPYITKSEYTSLPVEVKDHEPEIALIAGESGLKYYQKILEKAKDYLTPGGKIYFEIGEYLSSGIKKFARKNGFNNIVIYPDLAGRDRIMKIG